MNGEADISCSILAKEDFRAMYPRMRDGGLLWTMWPQYPSAWWSEERFIALLGDEKSAVIGGYVNGQLGGFLHLWPYGGSLYTKVGEAGVCAFREYFPYAQEMCKAAMEYVFAHFDCSCLIGHIPVQNIHALKMLEAVGFKKVCRVPQMGYFARKDMFTDGYIVLAIPNNKEGD